MKRMWISVMCKNGIETVLKADEIYGMQFDSEQILVLVGEKKFFFAIKEDDDDFNVQIITKEELEKLRVNLQSMTEEEK